MLIVAAVSIFIMSLSTLDSLFQTSEAYYRHNHFDDPVSAHLLSLPDNSPSLLNQIYLRSGRSLGQSSRACE